MLKLSLIALVLAVVPVSAQLESHTLTISATRQIILQPDQVAFGLSVSSPASVSLNQIVAALSSLNITAANLTGVTNSDPSTLQWNFSFAVPLSNLAATIDSLTKLQNNSGRSMTFNPDGLQVSPQLLQSQSCSTSDLIADAKAQALKLAQAVGMTVGPILRLSNETLPQPPSAPIFEFFGGLANFLLGPAQLPLTCSLTAEFQLLP